jgi:hypothetical protein
VSHVISHRGYVLPWRRQQVKNDEGASCGSQPPELELPATRTRRDDPHSAEFLLAEFERLRHIRSELGERSSRRFQFYVTITTAAVGAFVVLSQSQKGGLSSYAYQIAAFGLLVYGIVTFLNLAFASVFHVRIVRASMLIQEYFVDMDPRIAQYLYFVRGSSEHGRYRLPRVLVRGVAGGSEKSLIALIDSSLMAYLTVGLFQTEKSVRSWSAGILALAFGTFVVSGLLHAVYVTTLYRIQLSPAWRPWTRFRRLFAPRNG